MSFFTASRLLAEATATELSASIQAIELSGAKSLMVLACDQDAWSKDQIDSILQACKLPIFGGVFPSILVDTQLVNSGTLLIGLRDKCEIHLIENLSDDPSKFSVLLDQYSTEYGEANTSTTINSKIVIVDGLAKNIESLVEDLFIRCGPEVKAIGGGAGSLDFIQKPCIFSNKGLLQDAVVIAAIETLSHVGVQHGWEILDGPFLVTESNANCLSAINFQPAFDVYKENVEKHSASRFDQEDFFSIAKTYPLGIVSVDGELLVRDPLKTQEGALICVGEVPQHSSFYLLKGTQSNLISASCAALLESKSTKSATAQSSALMFDCISRQLFLEEDYKRVLDSVSDLLDENTLFFGALTLGEIANSSHGPIELLNKTTVVVHFD